MYFFPYAIPDSVPLVWAGGTVNVALAMSAIGAALFLAILALRAQRERVKETVRGSEWPAQSERRRRCRGRGVSVFVSKAGEIGTPPPRLRLVSLGSLSAPLLRHFLIFFSLAHSCDKNRPTKGLGAW